MLYLVLYIVVPIFFFFFMDKIKFIKAKKDKEKGVGDSYKHPYKNKIQSSKKKKKKKGIWSGQMPFQLKDNKHCCAYLAWFNWNWKRLYSINKDPLLGQEKRVSNTLLSNLTPLLPLGFQGLVLDEELFLKEKQ